MKIKGIIFDFGNTLFPTDLDWPVIMEKAFKDLIDFLHSKKLNVPASFAETYKRIRKENYLKAREEHKEYTAIYSLKSALSEYGFYEVDPQILIEGVKVYFSLEEEIYRPFPDAEETLRILSEKGFKIGLISNATSGSLIRRIIMRNDLAKWFDIMITSADVRFRKPRPEIFNIVIDKWNIPAQEIVMIGDELETDILGAKNVGMKSILVTMKARERNNEYKDKIFPDAVVDKLGGVVQLIENM